MTHSTAACVMQGQHAEVWCLTTQDVLKDVPGQHGDFLNWGPGTEITRIRLPPSEVQALNQK